MLSDTTQKVYIDKTKNIIIYIFFLFLLFYFFFILFFITDTKNNNKNWTPGRQRRWLFRELYVEYLVIAFRQKMDNTLL